MKVGWRKKFIFIVVMLGLARSMTDEGGAGK